MWFCRQVTLPPERLNLRRGATNWKWALLQVLPIIHNRDISEVLTCCRTEV